MILKEIRSVEPEITLESAARVARESAIEASLLVLPYWSNPTNKLFGDGARRRLLFSDKDGEHNFATQADLASEELLIKRIRAKFPSHDIITEESERERMNSPYQWVNDPIDGTLNFTNGLPDFAISVGLIHDGQPVIGVIALPAERKLISAQQGRGAHMWSFDGDYLGNCRDLVASRDLPLRKSIVSYDVPYNGRVEQFRGYVSKIADHVGAPTSYYSCATAQAKLAQGLIGGYIMSEPKIFDVGAGACILREAGCTVSQMDGSPIDWMADSRTYLAGRNSAIHSQLLQLINE